MDWYIYFIECYYLSLGQVDLWTKQQSGCSCSWDNRNSNTYGNSRNDGTESISSGTTKFIQQTEATPHDCACCVKGGCQCGSSLPTRCGQCGLEQYCVNSECSYALIILTTGINCKPTLKIKRNKNLRTNSNICSCFFFVTFCHLLFLNLLSWHSSFSFLYFILT